MPKQIFASIILALFYADGSWLNELTSMDHLVDANTINLSYVGADPNVIENNTTWPLAKTQRTDGGTVVALYTFDTEPTNVTNVEELETNYQKCESVLRQHADALREHACISAAYNISPANSNFATSGAPRSDGNFKMTYNDILRMRTEFNKQKCPMNGRIVLLSPEHEEDLLSEDANRYHLMMQTGSIAGFKVYTFTDNPQYNTSGAKQPKGTNNQQPSSVFFHKSLVMRAMGDIEGEPEKRWADYRGWLIGLQMRFVALPMRANQGVLAMYSGR